MVVFQKLCNNRAGIEWDTAEYLHQRDSPEKWGCDQQESPNEDSIMTRDCTLYPLVRYEFAKCGCNMVKAADIESLDWWEHLEDQPTENSHGFPVKIFPTKPIQ